MTDKLKQGRSQYSLKINYLKNTIVQVCSAAPHIVFSIFYFELIEISKKDKKIQSFCLKFLFNTILMYRLLQISQAKRHLKIENNFSSHKYPIYYSHEQGTLETYLTKVVTGKDQVINYYKAHLAHNVLPYLQMKREIKAASLLSLPPQQAEVIIKINRQEKESKCKAIQDKIEKITEMMEYYVHFHRNDAFQQQLSLINKLTHQIQSKDDTIKEKLHEIQGRVDSTTQLLAFFNDFTISNLSIIQKLESLRKDYGEFGYQDLQNFTKFTQELVLKKGGSIQLENLKENEKFQLKQGIEKCQKVLIQISNKLKDIENQHIYEANNQIEYLYFELTKQEKLLAEEEGKIYESNVLYISKKFIKGVTLRQMIINKDPRLTHQFCLDLTKAIVDFVFMYGGVKDLFITTENIIVEDCGSFHLNYFSFVGLEFLKMNKYIDKHEFLEIVPYVTSEYLESCRKGDINMQIGVLLRFIIVNFVSAFFKRDIVYDAKSVDLEIQVRIDSVQGELAEIEKKLLHKVVSEGEIQKIKENFDDKFKVKYAQLVSLIFPKENSNTLKENSHKLSWELIFSKLSMQKIKNSETISRINGGSQIKKVNIYRLSNNYNQNSFGFGKDVFYVINISFMEAIDHFINILYVFTKQPTHDESQSKLLPRQKEKITKMASQLIYERDFFEKKGWYHKEIYIPVKTGMTFIQILDYYNWVQMLYTQTKQNLQTIKAIQNLLSFMLQVQQNLKLIQPLINDDLLQRTQIHQKCKYYESSYSDGKFKTYYTLIHNYTDKKAQMKQKEKERNRKKQQGSDEQNEDNSERGSLPNSQSGKQEETQDEIYDLKSTFWKYFFATWKVIYILIKNYYLRINQLSVNRIPIAAGKFSQWLQQFNPTTPPLSSNQ